MKAGSLHGKATGAVGGGGKTVRLVAGWWVVVVVGYILTWGVCKWPKIYEMALGFTGGCQSTPEISGVDLGGPLLLIGDFGAHFV